MNIDKVSQRIKRQIVKQANRKADREFLSATKQAIKDSLGEATAFVFNGTAYQSKIGETGMEYFSRVGGTGKTRSITEDVFNKALEGYKASGVGAKLKDKAGKGASGALGGLNLRASAASEKVAERLGVSRGVSDAIVGSVGGAGVGAVVGGTIAAVDGNDNTTVMGGALGGTFLGGIGGAAYGGFHGFTTKDLDIAEDIAKAGVDGPPPAPKEVAEEIAESPIIKEGKNGQYYYGDTEPIEPKPSLYKQEADGQMAWDIATGGNTEQQIEGQQTLEQLFPEVMNPGKKEPASAVLPDGPEGEQMDFFDMLNSRD